MFGFDLIHTYSSDALAQGILKSFFAFTNALMPLPRSEPVNVCVSCKCGHPGSGEKLLCVCMYVFMYVCMYVCMYVRMYVYVYACMHAFMYVYMHAFMYAFMYACVNVCMYVYTYVYM